MPGTHPPNFLVGGEVNGNIPPILLRTFGYTHPFNSPLSGTTRVSQYQKGKTNLDFTEARDSEWQWNPLGHMQVCTSLQTDNHASTPPLSFFTGRMPFLLPNQHRQSTESTFGYSRTILVALRSFSLKPISFGYKTPPIRFSQAGGQSAHKARPNQP